MKKILISIILIIIAIFAFASINYWSVVLFFLGIILGIIFPISFTKNKKVNFLSPDRMSEDFSFKK